MKAIYLKEMRSYFHSLAAYIYFALFIAATGVYFSVICMSYGYTDYSQYVFSNSTILYIVIVPILTMRLFAEEKKQRTDQLLYTSPIRPGSIVLGKYLASVTLLAMSMLVSLIEAGVLSMFGSVSWKTVLTGCLGYFLLGACLILQPFQFGLRRLRHIHEDAVGRSQRVDTATIQADRAITGPRQRQGHVDEHERLISPIDVDAGIRPYWLARAHMDDDTPMRLLAWLDPS